MRLRMLRLPMPLQRGLTPDNGHTQFVLERLSPTAARCFSTRWLARKYNEVVGVDHDADLVDVGTAHPCNTLGEDVTG